MKNFSRIIVPLDVESCAAALSLVGRLRNRNVLFKIGLQLFSAAGPDVVRRVVDSGEQVFLDLKLHDIPTTVALATREAAKLGVSLLTVHASGGAGMMSEAAEAAVSAATSPTSRMRLLGVTVLTSLDTGDLQAIGISAAVVDHVSRLALLAKGAGLDGVVASPHEIEPIRKCCGAGFLIVTPGIRPTGSPRDDQKRTMTPREATNQGADYLVIGRPITQAPNPAIAFDNISREIG